MKPKTKKVELCITLNANNRIYDHCVVHNYVTCTELGGKFYRIFHTDHSGYKVESRYNINSIKWISETLSDK